MDFELEKRLREYYDARSRQDAEAVMGCFTDTSVFEDRAFAARFRGLEQIRSFVDLTFEGAPDFQVRPTQIIAGDGVAAVAWTMSGTHSGDYPGLPATGKRFEVRASSVVSFREDKIKTIVDDWNPIEFQRSVGSA